MASAENKKVQNVQGSTEIAKEEKKPKRRMKKQVRKTLGGLFLASAVVVAAIPTQGAQATFGTETPAETIKVSVGNSHTYTDAEKANLNGAYTNYYANYLDGAPTEYYTDVPFSSERVDSSSKPTEEQIVYTSDDGLFQFVYMRPTTTNPNKVAVILGYNGSESSLTIPDTLEGFRKYRENETNSGYCLVSLSDEFLHYQVENTTRVQKTHTTDNVNYLCYVVTFEDDCVYNGVSYSKNQTLPIWSDQAAWPGLYYDSTEDAYFINGTKTITPDATEDEPQPTPYTVSIKNKAEPEMETKVEYSYEPCYAETRSTWDIYGNNDDSQFYYYPGNKYYDDDNNPIIPTQCGQNYNTWRIRADVAYIGQEYLVESSSGGTWSVGGVITDPSQGVFANNPSLTNLTLGSNIIGVGDFAFYGCSTLSSVSFGSKLKTIGNGAFSNCIRLSNCEIASNANIRAIGKDAFYNCRSLASFNTNVGLQAIGDSCFENCIALTTVNFSSDGGEVDLSVIGSHAFRGCTALAGIEFPASYYESKPLEIDTFEGCTSLQYIKINNNNLDFDVFHKDSKNQDGTTGTYPNCTKNDWDKFKATVPASFYFEGNDSAAIHTTCKDNSIAFKYMNEDRYERKVYEIDVKDRDTTDSMTQGQKDSTGNYARTAPITYQINSSGEIINVAIEKRAGATLVTDADGNTKWQYTGTSTSTQAYPVNLTIPEKIGPYGIDTIGDGAFANNCYFSKVTIPASVTSIGSRAFAGCHNLETVIYTDATKVQSIGTDAFKTQDCPHSVVGDNLVCSQCGQNFAHRGNKSDNLPELMFCGAMINTSTNEDTVPFQYATNGVSNINNSDQITSWIKYHSGWPTNLVVQYNYNSITGDGEVELVDYPRYTSFTDSSGNKHYGYDDPSNFVDGLPYIDKDDDLDKYNYYVSLVSNAVNTYTDYETDPRHNPAPTEQQMTLINAALNIVVPTNVDAIEDGIFSGAEYDGDGYPIYFVPASVGTITNGTLTTDGNNVSGYCIYTDAAGKLYTDSNKSTAVRSDEVYLVTKEPYIKDTGITNTDIKTITLNGVDDVAPFAFYGCTKLQEASVIGPEYIGDYAFDGCTALTNVTLGSNLSDTGLRPFRGCTKLDTISPLGSNYTYDSGILYKTNSSGTEIVECLEGRGTLVGSYSVGPTELSGVTSIKDEAFMNCDNIGKVDLSGAEIDDIPFRAFRDADSLNSVILGSGVSQIKEEAFYDTEALKTATLPYSLAFIAQDAFSGTTDPTGSFNDSAHKQNPVIVSCVEGSNADKYANNYVYLKPEYGDVYITHYVYFWDNLLDPSNPELLGRQIVNDGDDAIPPTEPSHDGYTFTGWTSYTNIVKDTDVYAQFTTEADPVYAVDFLDYDGTKLTDTQYISEGKNATPPDEPEREGYTFTGWKPNHYIGVNSSYADDDNRIVIVAQYSDNSGDSERHTVTFYSGYDGSVISEQKVNHGEAAVTPATPTYSGYTFRRFIPSDFSEVTEDMTIVAYYERNTGGGGGGGGGGSSATATPTATSNNNNNNNGEAKTYTVSVSGGSGSGNYPAGAVVAINAYDMGVGQVFDRWTTSTAGVAFANPTASSTSFVMPAANVAITATYRTGSATSATSSGSGGSGGGTATTTRNNNTGATTVDISKGGISNTGVAGATVSGSTDNFVVKITDDQNAADAALRALQNAFGDITRLKYLPMDISLYDSTGRTKIADTSGLSVSITMPIPDELAQYAGNNKIASVSGGVLENLNSRFTTVDGVPCISFTATHFSPYVIYVDTGNLTESTIDYTPKTGDPIHPKWFLAIGLACISFILFFKKDKRVKVKTA